MRSREWCKQSLDDARTVWQSVDNIIRMERSLGAFWAALADELDVIGGDDLAFVEGKHNESTSGADDCWVYTGECRSYRLEVTDGGDERVLKGVVSVRIELWRPAAEHSESSWPYAKIPLIYVAFHRHEDSDSDDLDYYTDFGLDRHGKAYHDGEEGSPYCARPPLWIWNEIAADEGEWIRSSWFFAVPLIAMISYDDLRNQITEPLRELLFMNRAPEDVFRDRGAVRTGAADAGEHADGSSAFAGVRPGSLPARGDSDASHRTGGAG